MQMTPTSTIPGSPASVAQARLLYRPDEAAELLGVSPRTLWSISQPRGELPVVRIGSVTRYAHADLVSYIDRAKNNPPRRRPARRESNEASRREKAKPGQSRPLRAPGRNPIDD